MCLWVMFLFFVFADQQTLCVQSKRSRVYFQNAPVCAVKTHVSCVILALFDGTRGNIFKVHMGAF